MIDSLPDSIKELILKYNFNLELNNLPNSIQWIQWIQIFNELYNKELNNLPNSVEYLKLPLNYRLEIKNIPTNLKTIKCNKDYKYIESLKKIEISI